MNGRIILGIASFLYCIAGVVSYHPFFFPRYQPDNYVSVHKSPASRNPFEFKRRWHSGFDRLSMGFIKRDKNGNTRDNDETMRNNDETSSLDVYDKSMYDKLLDYLYIRKAHENPPQLSKRYFDRLSSGFIRKKRSAVPNSRSYVGNSIQKSQLNVQKNVDTTNPMEHPDSVGKKEYDRHVTEQEQGREDAVSGKRGFDRLNAGFVKRPFDRLNSGFVKRPFDRLNSGFVKRPFDRLNSGFVKRPFDRLNSGFVKRPFDRLNSGFVKRPFDRLSSGFVKRPFDRLTSGFVKRPSESELEEPVQMYIDDEKRGFDRLNYGFVKRPFDRLNFGFVKKDAENVNNGNAISEERYFDRMNMGFIKRDSLMSTTDATSRVDDKQGIDRLNSGFVKKDDILDDRDYLSGLSLEKKDCLAV